MQSSGIFFSLEDSSTSGSIVFRGQHEDSGLQTVRSRLGIQERTSSSFLEDSAANLAEVLFLI